MHSLFDWVVVAIAAVWLGIVFIVIIKNLISGEALFSSCSGEIPSWLKNGGWWSKYLILGIVYFTAMDFGFEWGETTGDQFLCFGIPVFVVLFLAFIINDVIEYITNK